jgi:hypothetical protein
VPALHWTLDAAQQATDSIDLRHLVGAAVGNPVVVCHPEPTDDPAGWGQVAEALRPLAVVLIAEGSRPDPMTAWADLVTEQTVEASEAIVEHQTAATIAAQVLRHRPPDAATARLLESLAYATLQAGADHQRWISARGRRVRADRSSRVALHDDTHQLRLRLTRGRLHNLIDHRMRNELAEALITIDLDPDQRPVIWEADGPSFCAGGDPAEFGTVPDSTTAHTIRSSADLAPWFDRIADRLTVRIDGPCVGAGIELAALAGTISAGPEARFRLPELTLGLIPGAGGTWSIPNRIGRQRTLEWLVLDQELDPSTAHRWGLVDELRGS